MRTTQRIRIMLLRSRKRTLNKYQKEKQLIRLCRSRICCFIYFDEYPFFERAFRVIIGFNSAVSSAGLE
ncbi:hypothetical protein ASG81_28535 [Paenibacillus sp. Soil522]|nr:hypothetical protein ASG81_28535 [Paenibacillus sp. Soil522]